MLRWFPRYQVNKQKESIRGLDAQQRRILSPEQVKDASHQIVAQLETMTCFQEAQSVMVYYPIQNEVDLRSLVKKYADSKTFLLPASLSRGHIEVRVYHKGEPLLHRRYGIPEPQTEAWHNDIDVIIVPGIAFGKDLSRLGRGGGYYDRFLAHYPSSVKIGVCYDFQLHDELPHLVSDQAMNRVVTPTKIIGA